MLLVAVAATCVLTPIHAAGQSSLKAQNPRPYVEFPVEGDFEAILKQLLLQVEGREQFESLLAKALENPAAFQVDPEKLKQIDLNNPLIKQRLKNLLDQPAVKDLKLDPEQKSALEEAIKKLNAPDNAGLAQGLPIPEGANDPPPQGGQPGNPPPPQARMPQLSPTPKPTPQQDNLREWIANWVQKMEGTDLHKMVANSPGMQRALEDLQKSMPTGNGDGGIDVGNWGDIAFKHLPEWTWKGSWWKYVRFDIGDLPAPHLPSANFSMAGLPGPSMPSASPPSAYSLAATVLIMLVVAAIAVIGWHLLHRESAIEAARTWKQRLHLGPWPVDPAKIRTREELVKAFEYVSLLFLGAEATTWNHQMIAAQLPNVEESIDTSHSHAATELARTYEIARYAPADESVPDSQMQQACKILRVLAGAGPA